MMKLAFSWHGISVQGWGNALTHPLGLGCLMGLTVLLMLVGFGDRWEASPLSNGEVPSSLPTLWSCDAH